MFKINCAKHSLEVSYDGTTGYVHLDLLTNGVRLNTRVLDIQSARDLASALESAAADAAESEFNE